MHPPENTAVRAWPLAGSRNTLRWVAGRVVPLAAIVFFGVYAVLFLRKGENCDWRRVYVRAAQHMQLGQPIHRLDEGTYTYPPAMALFAVPLANLPPRISHTAWYGVNVVAGCVAVGCAWRLSGGAGFVGLTGTGLRIFLLGMFLSLRFFISPLDNTQFDMVIAACLFHGCYQLWRGHDQYGAAWLGAAAAMKCTPLLFAPYLVWRGKPGAAFVLVAIAMGLNLVPDLVWPQTSGHSYVADWVRVYLSGLAHAAPGSWHSDLLLNQSLGGLVQRLMRFGIPLSPTALAGDTGELSRLATQWIRALTYGGDLLLVGLCFWRFGRWWQANPTVARGRVSPPAGEQIRTGIEVGAIVALMLLLSPMSSKAHYVVLLLPVFVLARLFIERPSTGQRLLLAGLLITGPFSAKDLVGKGWGDLMLAWGFPTWFALLALVGAWIALAESEHAGAAAGTAEG